MGLKILISTLFVFSLLLLNGCNTHSIDSDPPIDIPKNVLSYVLPPNSNINTVGEFKSYCVKTYKRCNVKIHYIIVHQKNFNVATSR